MSTALGGWVREHPLLAGALGCALVSTAHAEYTLATATGVHPWVALAVPGALDLYVIQALRVKRDVFVAVLVMVSANVVSHLMVNGLYPQEVHWQVGVTAAVGALAPVLLWRVHALERTRHRSELLLGLPAGEVSAPAAPEADERTECGCRGVLHPAPEPYPTALVWPDSFSVPAPDHVPADWMDAEYPETHPSAPAPDEWVLRNGDPAPDWLPSAPAPHLHSVPDLPAEFEPLHMNSDTLRVSDMDYLPGAQEYVDKTKRPSVRGLRRALSIGQDRAERLLTHLGVIL